MSDFASELYERMHDAFEESLKASGKLAKLEAKNRSGKASHKDALEYAKTVGDILQDIFRNSISSEDLPDGMLYYDAADKTIRPILTEACERVLSFTGEVQKSLNEAAGIGLKPVIPPVNQDRIEGIIRRLSDGE